MGKDIGVEMSEKEYLLWLSRLRSLNAQKQHELLEYFYSAENIYLATRVELQEVPGITLKVINDIVTHQQVAVIHKYLSELENLKIKYFTLCCDIYPKNLLDMNFPPIVMYYIGEIPESDLYISIIGSRRCTDYGKFVAHKFSKELAKENIVVISGMALGADTVAHVGCLEGEGKTIAVVGSGLDICYPKINEKLMGKIINNGCVMSEYPPGTPPIAGNFPMRNRIISALSDGLIVVEAAHKSGTMITVDHALEQGRTVFTVPGNITSKNSQGTNHLLRQGAIPLTDIKDILEEFSFKQEKSVNIQDEGELNKKLKATLTDDEIKVYKVLNYEPKTVDEITFLSKESIQNALYLLTVLELKGAIKKFNGQKYIRA